MIFPKPNCQGGTSIRHQRVFFNLYVKIQHFETEYTKDIGFLELEHLRKENKSPLHLLFLSKTLS